MISDDTVRAMREICDGGLKRHGFVDYLRDYELLVDKTGPEPATPELPDGYRVLFRNCVIAEVTSALSAEVWRESLGDRLLEMGTALADGAGDNPGFIWALREQSFYPGGEVVESSARAAEWTESVGIEFCEVLLDCDAQTIRLVYSGISIEPWDPATLRSSTETEPR